MAQQIVTLCDVHADEDEHRGSPQIVSLDGSTFRIIDMCEDARKKLIDPLRELLDEHGRVISSEELAALRTQLAPKKKTTKGPTVECPKCGALRQRGSMREHMISQHDTTLAIVEGELGHTLDGRKIEHWCGECGGGFVLAQSLGAHLAQEHGIAGSSTAAEYQRQKRAEQRQDALIPAAKKTPAKKSAKKAAAKS